MVVIYLRGFSFMFFSAKKLSCYLTALRAYSLPISVMSWTVPFMYAIFDGGNIFFGVVALFGIIILHLGSNLFDDIADYLIAKRKIEKGIQKDFNFQSGKCICLFNGPLSLKNYIITDVLLFSIAVLIAGFFIFVWGSKLFFVLVPAAILCLLYPVLGCLGFGEIIIAVIFAPLLYMGTYFVMTGEFSFSILLLSVPTGLLSVAVLHNHMLLDYKLDEKNRKITLCRLCGSLKNAYLLLFLIVVSAYLSIIIFVFTKQLNCIYLLTLLSIPTAYVLLKVMYIHIKSPETLVKPNIFMGDLSGLKKADKTQKNFLIKFFIVRNLLSLFTLLLCISIAVEKCIL
mgnify:CR=1 FL=1